MPQVHLSPYFGPSMQKAYSIYGRHVIVGLVSDFFIWKEQGKNPSRLTDKSSAKDDSGKIFRPYQINNYRHVSFRLKANGDPVLAFRVLANGDVMLVCLTTKHEMFALKKQFKSTHSKEFPK